MEFGLEWTWSVMGQNLIQTPDPRLIDNTARASCDLLAKNSAHMPDFIQGGVQLISYFYKDRVNTGPHGPFNHPNF
jgi:hypothetical protein